jgi:cytochrome c556
VWSDRPGFEAQASAFQTATAQLLAATQAGDKGAFATAYKATGAACASCHTSYRAEEAR